MTPGDAQFMKAVGIEPCDLNAPGPSSLPPPPPGPSLIASLTKKDACWLLILRVMWEPERELGFW